MVLEEVGQGDLEAARRRLAATSDIPLLDVTPECVGLGQQLLRQAELPEKAARDALHIAIAAVNNMDVLLTWNCRHIANPTLIPKIRAIIMSGGYRSPKICTPRELVEDRRS